MNTYLVKFNFDHYRPTVWTAENAALFGKRNEGFKIQGQSEKEAIDAWNAARKPGKRMNPFYLKITQE